ncbi:ribonuclease R [Acidobacteriota bacterium]
MLRQIFSLIAKNRQGLTLHKIAKVLQLSGKEKSLLEKNLQELENRGAILRIKNRYIAHQRSSLVRGKVVSVHPGFGFIKPEDELMEDIFIPSRHFGKALLGDVVEVFYKEKPGQKRHEGRVIRVLEKGRDEAIGFYRNRRGLDFFQPYDSPSLDEIPLRVERGADLKEGTVLKVDRETMDIFEILGLPDEPGVDTQVIIDRFELASLFPEDVLDEAERIPGEVQLRDLEGRVDFRDWPTVTIDGPNAQDFDDAVSIKVQKNKNILLGVHIADVSHYVKTESALDSEAFRRGTSVYFPGCTLPMLPERLSNGICSLRPNEDKLTMSVLLELDGDGNVVQARFQPSVIKTVQRLTYESVYAIYEGDEEIKKMYRELVPDLLIMRDLAQRLREKRLSSGSLDFDIAEPQLVYEEQTLLSVIPSERNEAHQLIEEFMVAANEAVASHLLAEGLPLIFRVHPPPVPADLLKLRDILAQFGIFLPETRKLRSKDLQSALDQAQGKPEEKFISLQILKSLRLAVYSDENRGHYGLAKEEYTHFTSPIRRYPDLVVHRILKMVLQEGPAKILALSSIAHHCTEKEKRADEAEKELLAWRIFRLLKTRLGDEFEGVVVDMSRAGLFVELKDYFVEGLIPVEDLRGDFHFRRDSKSYVEKRTGYVLGLGVKVNVILASVDPIRRRMILTLS